MKVLVALWSLLIVMMILGTAKAATPEQGQHTFECSVRSGEFFRAALSAERKWTLVRTTGKVDLAALLAPHAAGVLETASLPDLPEFATKCSSVVLSDHHSFALTGGACPASIPVIDNGPEALPQLILLTNNKITLRAIVFNEQLGAFGTSSLDAVLSVSTAKEQRREPIIGIEPQYRVFSLARSPSDDVLALRIDSGPTSYQTAAVCLGPGNEHN